MNKLEQLKKYTVIVADTGDFNAVEQYKPQDCTTNPSLILKAAEIPQYLPIVENAVNEARQSGKKDDALINEALDYLSVSFGEQLAKIVPGRVSTEVDASLSFDTDKTIDKARRLIALYENRGISRERILIKIAATWEGICAAKVLESENINCNLTLIFNKIQAAACAEAGAYLISPFVGRILDWHKKETGKTYDPAQDPGVISVTDIYNYYKVFGFKTIVMGASFRSKEEIEELSGIDRLTISPDLLQELQEDTGSLHVRLSLESAAKSNQKSMDCSEKSFRWHMNQDAMATEKLAQGIRAFHNDTEKLRSKIQKML